MGDARVRIIRGIALASGATLAWLEWQASPNADRTVLAFDVAVGLTFIGAAVITLGIPSARRIAYLELATGVAWFAGALMPVASGVYLGFLVHLLATYPTGRIERTVQRAVVAIGYGLAVIASPVGWVGLETALLAAAAATALFRASRTAGPLRRGRLGAAAVAATLAVAFALVTAGVAAGTVDFATARMLLATVLIVTTAALAIDLRWGGWSRDALTRLVIDLGDRAQATTLRDRLAAVLDDPSLVIGYGLDAGGSYVDDDGRPVEVPATGSGRIAVPLRLAGLEVGVLVRDERRPIDPILADGVAAAAELALGNVRLHAATRRQLADLEASRERLIAAAESERQRIRRELDDGAMRRLAGVRAALVASVALGPEGGPLLEHAGSVMRQLEELSSGLGPASALEGGLDAALRRLAADASVPTQADGLVGRLPQLVEATAFFVCSEGLANIAKHARASRAAIRAHERAGRLIVEVLDDGVGGATPSPGSGLDGLRQRVESTGGRLTIEDAAGRRHAPPRRAAHRPLSRPRPATDPAGRTA